MMTKKVDALAESTPKITSLASELAWFRATEVVSSPRMERFVRTLLSAAQSADVTPTEYYGMVSGLANEIRVESERRRNAQLASESRSLRRAV